MQVFHGGPRLSDGIDADRRRQAVASLRGYAYQLYASALAWIGLGNSEQLFLEVAEDYAVLSQGALDAVQVRDNARSGALTLRSAGVAQTLESFIDLRRRNPDQQVTLRYLTTAGVAAERAIEDRPAGIAGLTYWRRAAAGADVAPLRDVLQRLDLNSETLGFIAARDDDTLRAELLQRIHWDAGAADIGELRKEFEAAVFALGQAASGGLSAAEVRTAAAAMLDAVLTTILTANPRQLTAYDRAALMERISHLAVPRRDLESLLRGAADGAAFAASPPWRHEDDTPMPLLLAPRHDAAAALAARARREGMAFAYGATGMGKSLLARMTARTLGSDWMVADFGGLDPSQTADRLRALLGLAAARPFRGLILDDLNETDTPEVVTWLARLRLALARRDRLCLITAYRDPPSRLRSMLGLTSDARQEVVDLTEPEVARLIAEAGGDSAVWTRAVFLATACGHPQLTQATIADLQWRSWPRDELEKLYSLDWSGLDLAAQRAAARRRLVETAPEPARALLARLSLMIGSFRREVALEVAGLDPAVSGAGDHLDALTGPWIDPVGRDRLRLSPLLSDAAASSMTAAAQIKVHRAAAGLMLGGRALDVQDADAGVTHALIAKSREPLQRLALSVIREDQKARTRLAGWLTTLQMLRADQPIFPEHPATSRLLRLAQVLLITASEDASGLPGRWEALLQEISEEPDTTVRETFELMALTKVMLEREIVSTPGWVAHLARMDSLLKSHPELSGIFPRLDAGQPASFYFSILMTGLRSVSALADCFNQLAQQPAEMRDRLLAGLSDGAGGIGHAVSHAWVAERDDGKIDGRPSADIYLRLARQAKDWGQRELAIRCHVARSVMFDEYADDEAAALAALSLAEQELGPDLILSRARAKIAYRRRRHADALTLMREVVAGGLSQDAVERLFLCREAAISATEVGEQEEALHWFRQAHAASQNLETDSLRVTSVGLQADAALAAWRCGDAEGALSGLWSSLEAARAFDPAASLKATYLHKVLGHACLWLNGQITRQVYPVDGERYVAPPGLCSNPEPSEDIRTLPPSSLEGSHYLLAAADIYRGGTLGFDAALEELLAGRHIFTLECQRRLARLERAVATLDMDALPGAIGDALEAMALGVKKMRSGAPPANELPLVSGAFPRLPEAERRGESAELFVNDTFFALRLLADLREDGVAAEGISALTAAIVQAGYAGPTYEADSARHPGAYLVTWRSHRTADTILAEDLFVTGLHMINWASKSLFQRAALPDLGAWAGRTWTHVLAEQRFRLRNPMVTAPAIEAAIAADVHPADRLSAILAAARFAFKYKLPPDIVALLEPGRA